jgi:hypothetical protein
VHLLVKRILNVIKMHGTTIKITTSFWGQLIGDNHKFSFREYFGGFESITATNVINYICIVCISHSESVLKYTSFIANWWQEFVFVCLWRLHRNSLFLKTNWWSACVHLSSPSTVNINAAFSTLFWSWNRF